MFFAFKEHLKVNFRLLFSVINIANLDLYSELFIRKLQTNVITINGCSVRDIVCMFVENFSMSPSWQVVCASHLDN